MSQTARSDQQFAVEVAGGRLNVHRWGQGHPQVVLALHGITGTGAVMRFLGEQLSGVADLLAPDLRGRGGSRSLPGPFGLDRHAEDLLAVLDAVGVDRVTVLGHSLGAAVGAHLAIHAPDRVARMIMIDGGPVVPLPPGVDVEEATRVMLGPSLQRLRMTFPSREAYHDYWRKHPAFADDWGPHVEWFCDSDLTGEEPELRSCVSEEAVEADGLDLLRNATLRERFAEYTGDVLLLRAPRDLLNRPQPLIPDQVVTHLRSRWPQLRERTVADVNHYTILLSDEGVRTLSTVVAQELERDPATNPGT